MRPRSKSVVLSGPIIEEDSEDETDSSDEDSTIANSNWTPDDQISLLCQVKKVIPEKDDIPFTDRIKEISWENIRIKNRSSADVKTEFRSMIESSRTFRVLEEIIKEKHSQIIPKLGIEKPRPAFLMFLQDNKDTIDMFVKSNPKKGSCTHIGSVMFKESSEEVQEFYKQKAKKAKEKYENLIAMYELPKGIRLPNVKAGKNMPVQLFLQEKMLRNPKYSKIEARKEYMNLSKEEKLKWILRWIGLQPGKKANKAQYLNCKKYLKKSEIEIYDEYEGRPKFVTAYNMFVRDRLANKSIDTNLNASRTDFKSSVLEWKNLPPEEKKNYVSKAKALKRNFLGNFTRFVTSLPSDRQEYEINLLSNQDVAPNLQSTFKTSEVKPESDEENYEHDEKDATANERSLNFDENDSDQDYGNNTNADKSISGIEHDSSRLVTSSKASQTKGNEDEDDDDDDNGSYNYHDDDRGETIFQCDTSALKGNIKRECVRDSSESKDNVQESPKKLKMSKDNVQKSPMKLKATYMTILHSTPNVTDNVMKFAKRKQQSSKEKPSNMDTDGEEISPSYKAGIGRERKHKSKETPKTTTESFSDSEDKTPIKSNKRKMSTEQNSAADSKKFKAATTSNSEETRRKVTEVKPAQLEKKYQKLLQRKPPETLLEYYAQLNFDGSLRKANKYFSSLAEEEQNKIKVEYEKVKTKYTKKFEAFAKTLSTEEISHFSALFRRE